MPKYLYLIPFLIALFFLPFAVEAQTQSLEIVTGYELDDGNAGVGDVIARVLPENKLRRAQRLPNESIVGVIIPEDLALASYKENPNHKLVAPRGIYAVNVTNINGDIFPGDFITSSPIPGKGEKASSISEAILGLALEKFDGTSGQEVSFEGKTFKTGTILVDLAVRPNSQNLGAFKEVLNLARSFGVNVLSQFQTSEGSSLFIRYLLAAVVTILTIYFAFRHFGTSILRGIEAIGRNPLARGHIQSAIIINAVIIIFVSLSVVILSLFIIRL